MKKLLTTYTVLSLNILSMMVGKIAYGADDDKISVTLNEPIGNTAVIEDDTVMGFINQYIKIMYTYGASILGLICVLVIAVSGMQYAMDANSAEDAKKRIINSLSGLALLFLSGLFLWFINPNFFVTN